MKQYVIIKNGSKYSLKERIAHGFYGYGIFISKDLNKVKTYAKNNNIEISAIGDIWEVTRELNAQC